MRVFSKQNLTILVAIIVIAISFFVGFLTGKETGLKTNAEILASLPLNPELGKPNAVDFSPFWETWRLIDKEFVGPELPSQEDKLWRSIQGLVSSLDDPYSVFFPPKESKDFTDEISGNFEGVGMEIEIRDQVLTVVAPLKGTPAERAGILPGDIILEVGGVKTRNLTISESVDLIRGEKGSEVIITVFRESTFETIDIPVTRSTIQIPIIETQVFKENKVFLISLFSFSANSAQLFQEALNEFVQLSISEGYSKLIIDLRNNPGGFLEASVDIASFFLPSGKIIVQEDFGGGEKGTIFRSKGYDVFTNNLKLVILVNGGSASASEILAGALSQQSKATLVGENTFGKGSVQQLFDVTSDTSVKITVARWLLPDGTAIDKEGIAPDVEVGLTREDFEAGRDPQLDKAIEVLTQ